MYNKLGDVLAILLITAVVIIAGLIAFIVKLI